MTEREIQRTLFWQFRSGLIVLPNYTPADWFECDLFHITRAGYWHEHEIKLTVSDFKADEKKARAGYRYGVVTKGRSKHERLAAGDPAGPTCFWFVFPAGMVEPSSVPAWAGIKVIAQRGGIVSIRSAPRLHVYRASQKIIRHAFSVTPHRFWNIRLELERAQREVEELRGRLAGTCQYAGGAK